MKRKHCKSAAKRLQVVPTLPRRPISVIIRAECVFSKFDLNSKFKMQILFFPSTS